MQSNKIHECYTYQYVSINLITTCSNFLILMIIAKFKNRSRARQLLYSYIETIIFYGASNMVEHVYFFWKGWEGVFSFGHADSSLVTFDNQIWFWFIFLNTFPRNSFSRHNKTPILISPLLISRLHLSDFWFSDTPISWLPVSRFYIL